MLAKKWRDIPGCWDNGPIPHNLNQINGEEKAMTTTGLWSWALLHLQWTHPIFIVWMKITSVHVTFRSCQQPHDPKQSVWQKTLKYPLKQKTYPVIFPIKMAEKRDSTTYLKINVGMTDKWWNAWLYLSLSTDVRTEEVFSAWRFKSTQVSSDVSNYLARTNGPTSFGPHARESPPCPHLPLFFSQVCKRTQDSQTHISGSGHFPFTICQIFCRFRVSSLKRFMSCIYWKRHG